MDAGGCPDESSRQSHVSMIDMTALISTICIATRIQLYSAIKLRFLVGPVAKAFNSGELYIPT